MKEKAEIELSIARKQLKQARESLEMKKESLRQTNQLLTSSIKASISSDELKAHSDYMTGLKSKIGAQELEVAEQGKLVMKKREYLLTKAKQYKVIEKLKEKDLKKWDHQQLQMEQKKMNEVAVLRYGREFL